MVEEEDTGPEEAIPRRAVGLEVSLLALRGVLHPAPTHSEYISYEILCFSSCLTVLGCMRDIRRDNT